MFAVPREHEAELAEVKRAVGISHHYFDGWVYLFLSNKKFDIRETIAKLQRRDDMERTVFAKYTITDTLHASMRAGIVQYIGRDRDGHPVLFFNTVRDHPKTEQRPERQANMDMFLSWAVRVDHRNPSAMVTWLINQKDASMLRNTDLIFQKDMALRISKFFPGVVGRMYICNMGSALTFVMKPLLRQLPSSISDCIFLFSAGDIRRGALLEHIDASVLPMEMGGQNDCDHVDNYHRFATSIESYVARCQAALCQGISIKQMEMMEEFNVDKDGNPLPPVKATDTLETPKTREDSRMRHHSGTMDSEETLDASTMQDPCAVVVDPQAHEVRVESMVLQPQSPSWAKDSRNASVTGSCAVDWNMSFATPPVPKHALIHRVLSEDLQDCVSVGDSSQDSIVDSPVTHPSSLYQVVLTYHDAFSFSAVLSRVYAQKATEAMAAQRDACVRDWISFCCQCVELAPKVEALLESLRRGATVLAEEELATKLRRCAHHLLNLFPQTNTTLRFPLLDWYAAGPAEERRRDTISGAASASEAVFEDVTLFEVSPQRMSFRLDCKSPDNLLLTAQAGAVEFVESMDEQLAVLQRKVRVERRLLLTWPPTTSRSALEKHLQSKAGVLWQQLRPLVQVYIKSKLGISIAEFIAHYGLLVDKGSIDESAEWYQKLFGSLFDYRELHRRNWLFYVFPPASTAAAKEDRDKPPTMEELLAAREESDVTMDTATALITLIEQSLHYTAEQLSADGSMGTSTVASRTIVERYLEMTKTKIYIPFETQCNGISSQESITRHKRAAAGALREAEVPLQEFLFSTASLALLQHVCAPTMSEDAIRQQLDAAKAAHTQAIVEGKRNQHVAMTFAKVCADLQGSFGNDPLSLLPVYPAASQPADGYALALELLFAVTMLRCRMEDAANDNGSSANPKLSGSGNRVAVVSPVVSDAQRSIGFWSSQEDVSFSVVQCSSMPEKVPVTVDVAPLMETLTAMEAPATRLASLKRVYIY